MSRIRGSKSRIVHVTSLSLSLYSYVYRYTGSRHNGIAAECIVRFLNISAKYDVEENAYE
jgi:hypothetical protein